MHYAVADGRDRFSGTAADRIEQDIKERALITNESQCPRCLATLWQPEKDFKFCATCGWMQENELTLLRHSKRGFIDHAYAGSVQVYKYVPLQVIITQLPSNKIRTTYKCPLFTHEGYDRRCGLEMRRHVHGLRAYRGKVVLDCLSRHRVILSSSTWTIFGEE